MNTNISIRQLSDRALNEILKDADHPLYDEACDEEDYRASCESDPRIAQAMGECSVGN